LKFIGPIRVPYRGIGFNVVPSENVIQMARRKKAFRLYRVIDLYKPATTSNKLIIEILKSNNCATCYNMLSQFIPVFHHSVLKTKFTYIRTVLILK